jgi:hypothetical protein
MAAKVNGLSLSSRLAAEIVLARSVLRLHPLQQSARVASDLEVFLAWNDADVDLASFSRKRARVRLVAGVVD